MEDLSSLFARSVTNPFAASTAGAGTDDSPDAAPDAGPVEAAPPLPEVTPRSMIRRGGGWANRNEF